jgi:DNA-binding transcriptional regulator YdaS (Cro superfamily)
MQLKQWLNEGRGRATSLAKRLGVSLGRVSQMAADGVPVQHMVTVRDFTGGSVSIDEMVQERTMREAA